MGKLNIEKQVIGSCNCSNKTPKFDDHDELCYFRLLMEKTEPVSEVLCSVGLEVLLSLANEFEIEGKFLDNPHDSDIDRASGRTFKECAERIRDWIENTKAA